MRVLGIDPGLTRCGWGVVDGRPGARPTAVGVGVIRTMAELDLELRLLELHTAVTALLREHRPDVVAIERVFTQNNKGTATGTAQAAGVAALAAAQADRPVAWHTPSEVKAAISGNGRADKEQVTLMVTRVLGLASAPKPADRRTMEPMFSTLEMSGQMTSVRRSRPFGTTWSSDIGGFRRPQARTPEWNLKPRPPSMMTIRSFGKRSNTPSNTRLASTPCMACATI